MSEGKPKVDVLEVIAELVEPEKLTEPQRRLLGIMHDYNNFVAKIAKMVSRKEWIRILKATDKINEGFIEIMGYLKMKEKVRMLKQEMEYGRKKLKETKL
jgi:excinuclease UvrABC helicase subunit UvrB